MRDNKLTIAKQVRIVTEPQRKKDNNTKQSN